MLGTSRGIIIRITSVWIALLLFSSSLLGAEMPSVADPLAFSKAAASVGKSHYLINCQQCHDADGRALANIDYIAADLTAPGSWYYGSSVLHIFRSIKFGAGLEMPPFKADLSDAVIWQIVAHVLNIGPQVSRPQQK